MEEQKKEYTGVWLPAFIVEDRTLPPNAKLLYAEIAGFKQCFASNTFFANRLGLTVRGVQKNLVLLQASGYVVVTEQKGKRILTVVRDELRFTPPRTQVHPPMNSGSYIDIHIDNNKKKDNTSASPTDSGTGQGEAQGLESVPRRCKIHSSQPNRDCPSCSTDQRKLFDSLVQELGLSRGSFQCRAKSEAQE